METNQKLAIVSAPFTNTLIRIKARLLCRRTDFTRSDYDDIRQGMRRYLLEKIHLFDPARGNLQAFVTNANKTWTAMELRHRKRVKRSESFKAVSLERTKVECDGDITTLGAVLLEEDGRRLTQAYPLSDIEQFELREAVEHAMKNLQPEDRAILNHAAEHGVARTAKTFNVSRRQVANLMVRARICFENAGLGAINRAT
jgi:DNA-directed RNA polymerase specialized sigma24 family protein